MLAERGDIITELTSLLAGVPDGNGVLTVLNGPPGMGKTTLLRVVADEAQAAGAQVLMAACSRAEAHHPYALLGQLMELPAIQRRHQDQLMIKGGQEESDGEPVAVAREVHQMVMDLARRGTVLIAVDDIQYADTASLHCLHYLARRLMSLPVMMVLTRGTHTDQPLLPLHQELLYRSDARHFHLDPLSADGVARMVREHSKSAGTPELVKEHYQLSGGNPLLVQALFGGRRSRPGGGEQLGGAAFGQAVLACLQTMGPLVLRVARCAAVLGGSENLHQLSRLSETAPELTERIVRALTAVGIIDGSRFRHPASQPAILDEIPADLTIEFRYRAAGLMHDDGEPLQRVARHLLAAGSSRSEWAVSLLRQAARQSLLNGEIWLAIRYLELAAECCTDESQVQLMKVQLADIYWHVRLAASAQRYLSLKASLLAGTLPAGQVLRAVPGMLWHLQMEDAVDVIDHVLAGEGVGACAADADTRHTRLLISSCFPGLQDRLRLPFPAEPSGGVSALPPDTAEAQAAWALSAVLAQTASEYTVAQAEQAVEGDELTCASFRAVVLAVMSLIYSDRLDAASAWCDRMISKVSEHEARTWQALIWSCSALVLFRRGLLKAAIDRAESALAYLSGQGWCTALGLTLATLIEAYTAMGDHRAAARHVSRPVPQALFDTPAGLHYLYARGQHLLATGNEHAALADFTACGERMSRWNMDTPALVPWRVGAAEAWLRLGDADQATRLAEEEMSRLGDGLTRAAGISLRCLAAVRDRAKKPAILHKALQRLQDCGDSYETARTLVDLSVAYNQLGVRAEARSTARRAWRLAKSCGAEELCQKVQPMHVSDAKEKEPYKTPPEHGALAKLSDSERRVALLASAGYTNRDISSKLFITVSTVEQHLTRVYRKMDIRGRDELPIELDNDEENAAHPPRLNGEAPAQAGRGLRSGR
jgi:ATP/maltotriose-dependent transcriptional regulator MalT